MSKFLEQINPEVDPFFINRKILQENVKIEDSEVFTNESINKNIFEQLRAKNLSDKQIEDIIKKQEKVKKILGLIKENKVLLDEVKSHLNKDLSNFKFEVDISEDTLVSKAIKQVFKKPNNKIDYEMYLYAKERLNTLYNNKIEEGLNE